MCEWTVIPIITLIQLIRVFCAVSWFIFFRMVDTFHSVVRHLACIFKLTLVWILIFAKIWTVYLIYDFLQISNFVFLTIIKQVDIIYKWKVKLPSSIFQCVIVPAMLYIMKLPIFEVFALLNFKYSQIYIPYYLRFTLLLVHKINI